MNFTTLTVEILISMSRAGLLPGFLFPGGVFKNDLFEDKVISASSTFKETNGKFVCFWFCFFRDLLEAGKSEPGSKY